MLALVELLGDEGDLDVAATLRTAVEHERRIVALTIADRVPAQIGQRRTR